MAAVINPAACSSLDQSGHLRRFRIDGSQHPAWFKVKDAWGDMPGSAMVREHSLQEGMTVDEAFEAEAAKLAAFADLLRGVFKSLDQAQKERDELLRQRDAVRAFLGTATLPSTTEST